MAENKDAEFIQPPNSLKSKVGPGSAGIDMKVLEQAEQVIANLQDNYLEWVVEDLKALQAAYVDLSDTAPGQHQAALEEVFRIGHDIKGQGGSFGYELMTAVGNSLCRFIEDLGEDAPSRPEIEVIKVHIDTLRYVIAERVEGDGGDQGQRLLKGLDAVKAKVGRAR